MSEKKLRKVRVQYVGHDIKGNEVKEDVDVYTTADAVTMDQQPLKEAIAKMISNTTETIVGGASEEYNSLKQIENKFEKTVLKDDISHDYKDDDIDKVLSTHGANIVLSDMVRKLDDLLKSVYDIAYGDGIYGMTSGMGEKLNEVFKLNLKKSTQNIDDLTKSSTEMKKVADNAYAMAAATRSFLFNQKTSSSQTAMNAVASSQTAMNAVASSQTAMNAVASSQTAMNAFEKVSFSIIEKVCKRGEFYKDELKNIYSGRALVMCFKESSSITSSYKYQIQSPYYTISAKLSEDKIARFVKPMSSINAKRNTSNTDGYSYIYYIPY